MNDYKRIQAAARKYRDREDIAQQAYEIWLRRSKKAKRHGWKIKFMPDKLCIDAIREIYGETRKMKVAPKFVTLSENIPAAERVHIEEPWPRKINFIFSTSDPNYKAMGVRMKLVAALFYIKGLTASEVAETLNKTRNYVNSTLSIFRSLLTNKEKYKEKMKAKNKKYSNSDEYRAVRRIKYHEKKARLLNSTNHIAGS